MDSVTRRTWLRERQRGIGGTDMASICGVGFHDAEEVYEEKVALEPIDRPPSNLMRMGVATEDLNAELYSERTGRKLVSPGLLRADSEPWAFATFDRIALGEPFIVPTATGARANFAWPVEMKYAPFFGDTWGPDGSDEIRDGYTVQATWEAIILRLNGHDVRRTDLSVLAGTGEHRVYPIAFDEQLGAMLLDIGRAFWRRVERREGIEGWVDPLAEEVAKRLVTIRPQTTVILGEDAEELVWEIEGLARVKKTGEEAEERTRFLKQQLAVLLGAAEVGVLPDGRRVKQSLIPGKIITPAPYERQPRIDVRILKPLKDKKGM